MRDYRGILFSRVQDPVTRDSLAVVDYYLRDVSLGFGRIQKGQIPDGSGNPIAGPSIDGTQFMFLPGRSGGQTVTGLVGDTSATVGISADAVGTSFLHTNQSTATFDFATVNNSGQTDFIFKSANTGAGLQVQFDNAGTATRFTGKAAISSLVRAFIEAGPGTDSFAFTGTNGATGTSLHQLFNYTCFNTWTGTALSSTTRVGVNIDPYDFRSSTAASQPDALYVSRRAGSTAGVPTLLVDEPTGSSTELAIAIMQPPSGTAPSLAIGGARGGFRHDGAQTLFSSVGSITGLVTALNIAGNQTIFRLRRATDNSNYVAIGNVAAWSDTLTATSSPYALFGPTTGAHRAFFLASNGTGDSYLAFTRFGVSSAYTLFSNAAPTGTDFAAPEATPTVLRLINAATGGADASVLLKIQSNRAGQSADFLEVINQAGATPVKVDSTGKLTALTAYLGTAGGTLIQDVTIGVAAGTPGGLYLDDSSGFTGQVLTGTPLTANRTWQFPDGSGTVLLAGVLGPLNGSLGSVLNVSTASNGTAFQDTTTTSKKLRFILSGAVGNNSITFTDTAARNFGFGNIGGNVGIIGDQTPAVSAGRLGKVDLTAQTAAIASTNLSNSPPAGYYIVHYTILDTTGDVTAGTIQFQINYTDDIGATTQTGATVALTGAGTIRDRGSFEVQLASGNISYQTNLTGIIGAANYSLHVRTEFMG